MKSRITIDVDYDNQPIIKIEYYNSEDVRDKLVKRFLEGFGAESTFANFYYELADDTNSRAKIIPIKPETAKLLSEAFYKEIPENKPVKE